MKIGIGLPNFIPNTSGHLLLEWSRLSEKLGFSTIATIDRIAYPTYESLITLSAAAAVTQKINIQTNILLSPIRNSVLLAKEVASLNQLSNGRLTLGIGVGSREDDYQAVDKQFRRRGKVLDESLDIVNRLWKGGKAIGTNSQVIPLSSERIPILIGGMSNQTLNRITKWGDGWTASGVDLDKVLPFADKVRQNWKVGNRQGSPKIVVLAYFALGEDAISKGKSFLLNYYLYLGKYASEISNRICSSKSDIMQLASAFQSFGIDELILFPTVNDINQVKILANVIL